MDPDLLISELAQGEEQARQLEASLDVPSAVEFCKSLARKIQSSFQSAISMAKLIDPVGLRRLARVNNTGSESPRSASDSPRSENSDRGPEFKEQERREMCKKRKSLPKWSSQVRVCSSGGGSEGPLDDGYSWRKYGQKDILGAKYPRGYYRCTHRPSQGCLATKQVQRSGEDPVIFDVTYRGTHTCHEKHQKLRASSTPNDEQNLQQNKPNPLNHHYQHHQQQQQQDQELLLKFRANLKVKTEGLGLEGQTSASSSSFSFPSTPVNSMKPEHNVFSSPPTLENHFMSPFSPTFISSNTSEPPNYFSLSPCQMSNYGSGVQSHLHASDSEIVDILSAATSAANSQMVDMDFFLGSTDFNPNFPFDGSNLF